MHAATAQMEVPHAVAEAAATGLNGDEMLSASDVFVRVGMLARHLHDTLRHLGGGKSVVDAVGSLPDARARLDYIADLTAKAAECVLNAAERAKSVQKQTTAESQALEEKWRALLGESPNPRTLWELGRETQDYFATTRGRLAQVDDELTEIMLAKDFHELTGQVIQRVTQLARSLEEQLMRLLQDAIPPAQRKAMLENTLAGLVISSDGRDDVVTSQSQVEDLLESLGF